MRVCEGRYGRFSSPSLCLSFSLSLSPHSLPLGSWFARLCYAHSFAIAARFKLLHCYNCECVDKYCYERKREREIIENKLLAFDNDKMSKLHFYHTVPIRREIIIFPIEPTSAMLSAKLKSQFIF